MNVINIIHFSNNSKKKNEILIQIQNKLYKIGT